MSPTRNGSAALQRFECGNAVEICNGITFDFYLGLPHMPLSSLSIYQWTPLHVAARYGRVATVQYLVDEKGVDINIKDNSGVRLHI